MIKSKKILLALLILVVLMLSTLSSVSAQSDNATPTGGDEWLTFRANPAHTGKTSLAGPPKEIEMKWRWRINDDKSSISASPAVTSDGTVYIATEGGYVASINPEGSMGWIDKLSGSVKSSPAVDSKGNVLFITEKGYVYYFDSAGELQWKSDFDIDIVSSPVVDGGTAYVGTDDRSLIAFNLTPDIPDIETESKKLLSSDVIEWSFLTPANVKSSPAFSGNTLFFGAGKHFYALNPNADADNESSLVKWSYNVNSDINSSPTVFNGKVYVGADDGYLYAFSENISSRSDEDIKKGELLWKWKTGGSIGSSPAVDQNDENVIIYVGSDNGRLYAVDEKGELQWTFSASDSIRSSPAVDGNGDIYFGSDNGYIYALFPDGSLKWRSEPYGKIQSSPAIGPDMKLYVGSHNGYLYCIGESTEESRKPDMDIDVSLSLSSIENNGNPTTISATITSGSESQNVLSRIASVVINLSPLNMIGFTSDSSSDLVGIAQELMLDDGEFDDVVAGDGKFTYAFGITNIFDLVGVEEGIHTFFLSDGLLTVGPVPLMVTVTDLYGNKISMPFALNILQKVIGTPPLPNHSVNNGLSRQTLNISFSSGESSILNIVPSQGSPGQRVRVDILGKNTNFTKNKTKVEIFNDEDFLIASALPENYDVDVLSDISLSASLNIVNTYEVTVGGLTGRWDVVVTTDLPSGSEERVVGDDLFEISGASAKIEVFEKSSERYFHSLQDVCEFTLDITGPNGGRPKGSPWIINNGYSRAVTIERAESGFWSYDITASDCTPTFKIITTGSNFGFLVGEVRDGLTGDGIDNATITAITGDGIESASNSTHSSGGGYYLLPLSAAEENYIVTASKNTMIDLEREIEIKDGEETNLNFSLKPELNCPLTVLTGRVGLQPFYLFRDKVLVNYPDGRRWAALYYKHACEVQRIILTSPEFAEKSRRFVRGAVKIIPELINTGKISCDLSTEVNELVDMLINLAGPELNKSLKDERGNILVFLNNLSN